MNRAPSFERTQRALLACLCGAALAATAGHHDLGLTRDGKPTASIVVAAGPTEAAVVAAIELRDHIKKISGADLPILPDTTMPQGTRVLVGESAATRALGLKSDDFKDQEYMIDERAGNLVLMGRDASVPYGIQVIGAPAPAEGRFGKAMAFDGVHDAVVLKPFGFDDAQGSFEAWVRLADGATDGTLFRLDGDPWSYHIVCYEGGSLVYATYDGKPNGGGRIKSEKLATGWHHVLATWDAAKGRGELFVDGKSIGAAAYAPTHCAKSQLQVGAMCQGAFANCFKGAIDEIRVSKTVRTPAGWDQAPPAVDPAALTLLHLDEGSGVPRLAVMDLGQIKIDVQLFDGLRFFFRDHGSSDAVHEFLERDCGVRWYAPTELGMVCSNRPTLTVNVTALRRTPAFACRYSRLEESVGAAPRGGLYAVLNNPSQLEASLWMLRLKFGGRQIVANHGLYGYYARFWEKDPGNTNGFEGDHPEYFAKGYKGIPPQMCLTDTGFVAQVVKDIRACFDPGGKNPGLMIGDNWVSLEPMDNDAFCKCDACKKWYTKDLPGERDKQNTFMSGKFSDYIYQFANKVQEEVSKTHPRVHVFILAYASHGMPPSFPLNPQIYVGTCLATRNWISPAAPKPFRKWIAKEERDPRSEVYGYKVWANEKATSGRVISMWLYHTFPAERGDVMGFHAFPGYHARTLANQLRMFAKDRIDGIFTCGIGEQLDTYVTLKYLDNPNQDIEALLTEFFSSYYGAAGAPLKRVYELIEATYGNPTNWPKSYFEGSWRNHETEEMAWQYLGTEERMKELAGLMAQARAAAGSEEQRRRVALFDTGPWQYMVEGQRSWLAKSKYAGEVEALKKMPPPSADAPAVPEAGGDLAKVAWAKASRFAVTRTHEGYPSERQIAVEIAHDTDWLYLRLSDPVARDKVSPNGEAFWGDRWEIFLSAQVGAPEWIQFGIKSDGRFACYTHPGGKSIASGATVACRVSDTGWVTELAVPIRLVRAFPKAEPNKVCLNLYRPASAGQTTLAWSPNFAGNGYNNSVRLGTVTLK